MTMLDDLVDAVLDVSGAHAPWLDALGLAHKLDLAVVPEDREGVRLVGSRIEVARAASHAHSQQLIAFAIAEWCLLEWGLRAPPAAIRYVAARVVCLAGATALADPGELAPELLLLDGLATA